MTTTPAALSEERLKELRAYYWNGGQNVTIDLVAAIDELLRLRSRPGEGMRVALEAAQSHLRALGVSNSFVDDALALPAAVAPGENIAESLSTLRYELTQWIHGANVTDGQRARLLEIAAGSVRDGALHRDAPAPIETARGEEGFCNVGSHTLSVTHVFDGEEVVTGGEDGQAWVATFADPIEAKAYVRFRQDWSWMVAARRKRAIAALSALKDDARDAERYRWLRRHASYSPFIAMRGPGGVSQLTEEHADAAIDAAIDRERK